MTTEETTAKLRQLGWYELCTETGNARAKSQDRANQNATWKSRRSTVRSQPSQSQRLLVPR